MSSLGAEFLETIRKSVAIAHSDDPNHVRAWFSCCEVTGLLVAEQARAERLLAGLRMFEAVPDTADPPWFYCAACDMYTSAPLPPGQLGHTPGCWLVDLIRDMEGS